MSQVSRNESSTVAPVGVQQNRDWGVTIAGPGPGGGVVEVDSVWSRSLPTPSFSVSGSGLRLDGLWS